MVLLSSNRGHEASFEFRSAECSSIDAELVEISENLHRAELTQLQRDEQIARWMELTDAKRVSAQLVQKPQGGRPEGGVSAASRDLGIERMDAQRAVKVARRQVYLLID